MATSTAKKPTTRRKPVPTPEVEASQDDALAALAALGPRGHQMIPVGNLVPHPRNPRQDLGDLDELTASVKASGVLQNLTVVPDQGEDGRFRIVIGHRRAAAAQAAGLAEVPATVDPDMGEADQLALMIAENVHRAQLTVVEEADGYQALLDGGLTRAQLSKRVGTPKTTVDKRLRLAALPAPVKAKVHTGQATLEDAFAIDDESLNDAQREQLAGYLGTSQFRWKLEDARRAAAIERERALLVQLLNEVGATQVENQSDVPRGYRPIYSVTEPAIREDGDSTWYWQTYQWSPGVVVYTPHKPQDPAPEDEDPAEVARREEQARDVADVATAAALRREFLTELIAGRRRLDAKMTAAVVSTFMAAAICHEHISSVGPLYAIDREWAQTLLGMNVSIDLDAADLGDPQTLTALVDATTPERVMLTALATAAEGNGIAVDRGWHSGPPVLSVPNWRFGWAAEDCADIRAWYDLLWALGYETSPAEQEALARGADDGAEE